MIRNVNFILCLLMTLIFISGCTKQEPELDSRLVTLAYILISASIIALFVAIITQNQERRITGILAGVVFLIAALILFDKVHC